MGKRRIGWARNMDDNGVKEGNSLSSGDNNAGQCSCSLDTGGQL